MEQEGATSYEITEKAQIAADYTKTVSELVEEHGEWIDSYHPEYEKMPRELSKTSVLNSIRSARVLLLRLYKMIEEDE